MFRGSFPRSLAVRHIEIYVNLKSKVVVSIIKLNYRHRTQHAEHWVGTAGGSVVGRRGVAVEGESLTTQLKSHLKAFLRVSVLETALPFPLLSPLTSLVPPVDPSPPSA